MGGIFSQQQPQPQQQPPMMVSKEAVKIERFPYWDTRNQKKVYEIIKSWEPDSEDFSTIINDANVPPIDSTLISEDLFLAQHPGHVRVSITIPTNAVKKPTVILSSTLHEIYVESLCETVSSFKDRIFQKIRVPANKQKLITLKSGVLEDHFSLAYYNVGADDDNGLYLSIEDPVARRYVS